MMLTFYKKTTIKSFLLISLYSLLFLSSCSLFNSDETEKPLTERELFYEKGLALFNMYKYDQASAFFLKISQQSLGEEDPVYDGTLWHLSIIYEKNGLFDRALMTLIELERRKSKSISLLQIQLSQMKNHYRLSNDNQANLIKNKIDISISQNKYGIEEIYNALTETVNLNYDLHILDEAQYIGVIQKYFIYVMESKKPSVNEKATDLLITLYDNFFHAIEKDNIDMNFRKKISISLLDQLRKSDHYKIDDLNINLNTISKFSLYAQNKQQILIEWLHQ